MTPQNANAWFAELKARKDREQAEKLEAAKEEAHAAGKEPFDLDAFEALWPDDPVSFNPDGPPPSRESRLRRWEREYYVSYPQILTMAALVEHLKALEPHGYFD